MRRLVLVAIALVCCLPLSQGVPSVAAPRAERAPVVQAGAAAEVPAKRLAARSAYYCWRSANATCRIKPGPTFNSPYGTRDNVWRNVERVVSTIRRTPRGATIRVMSWNIMSKAGVDALLDAQRRGVIIRVIMDAANQSPEVPNGHYARLARGLHGYNRYLAPARRSYAKKCQFACRRGNAGSAHAKFYLFSKVGASRNVVIQGSANLTTASATNQWNDLFTYTDKPGLHNFMVGIFNQMWQDRAVSPAWRGYNGGTYAVYFSPRTDTPTPTDPLTYALSQVRCKGAVNAGTRVGRTIIRSAPDVLRGVWGMQVARHLRRLWNEGCDVKIGYTIMGADVFRFLRSKTGRGPVPLRHLVQDNDGDGVFDNYFHLKAWTINGRMGNNKTAFWMMNGSSNVSDLSRISDENIGIFRYRSVTLAYQRFIDKWIENPPRSRPLNRARRTVNFDPYAKIDLD